MAPKAAANAAAAPRQDLPWALGILSAADAEPVQLPLALNFLVGLNISSLPHDVDALVQLVTLVMPFMCATDAGVSGAAIKVIMRLTFEAHHPQLHTALRRLATLQSFWSVIAYFHASFDAYAARLAVINAEPVEPPPAPTRGAKPDSRGVKAPPQPPVDPESTLPGPSKFALEAAISALSALLRPAGLARDGGPASSEPDAELQITLASVVTRDVTPLLALLRHHSSRIQLLTLRLIRLALRCEPISSCLVAADTVAQLAQLVDSSRFGAVREEAMNTLSRIMSACAPAMQLALDVGLPSTLMRLLLAPTTGQPLTPPPTPPPQQPPPQPPSPAPSTPTRTGFSPSPSGTGEAEDAAQSEPPGAPLLDFTRPVASAPEKMQDLSVALLTQLCKHHHDAVYAVLRQGGMQLLLALLPAPELSVLPEMPSPPPPPPPLVRRGSTAADTFFAGIGGIAGDQRRSSNSSNSSGQLVHEVHEVAVPPIKITDEWMAVLEDPPPLPLPPPAAKQAIAPLQAPLLSLLACLLSEPMVQEVWWRTAPTRRYHLQLLYMLDAAELPKPPPPEPVAPVVGKRSGAAAPPPPPPPPPPPDPTKPPFAPDVRAASLHCLLQLMKHPRWLQLMPHLAALQHTIRDTAHWEPPMVAPMCQILQRIMQTRLPPPPRAVVPTSSTRNSTVVGAPLPSPSPFAVVPAPPTVPSPHRLVPAMHPNGLTPAENGLAEQDLNDEECAEAIKGLAKLVRRMGDPWVSSLVAAAVLVLPDALVYAPPWPPLPSPPPTPPPPPLPTSQYLWDALGRPVMTDGVKLAHI